MQFQISEESNTTISEQALIPISFEYDRILELVVADNGFGGFILREKLLPSKESKNYDAIEYGDHPSNWADRFDVSEWGYIVARCQGKRVAGAVIAYGTASNLEMIGGRSNLAVLWDLRVAPDFRAYGVGAALFREVESWSRARECNLLKIETQNNNVAACKFYARQGCTLGAINRFAYPHMPNEVQLLWYKVLAPVNTVQSE